MMRRLLNVSVPTAHTLAFVREFLPAGPAPVLEVGAGSGELSAALAALRYSVIAIDSASDAVSGMHRRGLNAVLASWLDYTGPSVAAIIFSRSLHHLPLDAAVSHAKDLLASTGRLIVEGFAFADMPRTALEWLRALLVRLVAEGMWKPQSDGFLARVLVGADPFPASPADDHEIADAEMMRRALAAHGTVIYEASAAYIYRYLQPGLPDTPTGRAVLARTLREETDAITTGALWPLGRRWVVQT